MLDATPAAAGASALTVDGAVLNIFWELASVHAAKREARRRARRALWLQLTGGAQAAAKQLVEELCRAQREFDASKCAPTHALAVRRAERQEAWAAADAPSCGGCRPSAASNAVAPLVSYSLRRLARGLGSGREVRLSPRASRLCSPACSVARD